MIETVLFYIFIAVSMINTIHFGFYLVGANIYDIKKFKQNSITKKRAHKKSKLVSVLIPAHNEEKSIVRNLESVRHSSYQKKEIIVIDDSSTDNTRAIVRKYIKEHPKVNVKLMFKRKNVGKASAVNHGLRKAKGELIMTLDADSVIHKRSISNAVKYFDDSRIVGVAANVRVIDSPTILNLLQKFEYMIAYRSKKVFSVANCEYIVGGVASTYRADVMKKVGYYDNDIVTEDIALSLKIVSNGNKENRVVYAADVIAMTEGVQTFKALLRQRYRWKLGSLQSVFKYRDLFGNTDVIYTMMLTCYRIPMAFFGELLLLVEPFVLGYVVYCCLMLGSFWLVIGAYMTITIYLLWNILPDEHMNIKSKMRMIMYAPIMYFVMYIMNVVQFVAVIRCVFNYRKVLRIVKTQSTWKSPERQGQQAIFS